RRGGDGDGHVARAVGAGGPAGEDTVLAGARDVGGVADAAAALAGVAVVEVVAAVVAGGGGAGGPRASDGDARAVGVVLGDRRGRGGGGAAPDADPIDLHDLVMDLGAG